MLQGLCDDNEGVREVSLRAGQVMVHVLGKSHTSELLPGLSSSLFHSDWRIRLCSVSLLGDLLYLVGDTRAVGLTEGEGDDSGFSISSRAAVVIRAHIGDEHMNMVLSALYISRSDTSIGVRQGALQVWKSIVTNSPRTLKEIMSSLLPSIVAKLSGENSEIRIVAGKALGDIVVKMAEVVLPIVIPLLQMGLEEGDQVKREGICLG